MRLQKEEEQITGLPQLTWCFLLSCEYLVCFFSVVNICPNHVHMKPAMHQAKKQSTKSTLNIPSNCVV